MSANYTVELYKLIQDKDFKLFDFEYNFYSNKEEVKKEFEQLFIDHFYFREIGHETIARFKHQLKHQLNLITPYYTELYKTHLTMQEKDLITNKDLVETYTRETIGNVNSKNKGNVETKSDVNVSNINIESDTPQNAIDRIENYMSSASKQDTKNNVQDNSVNNSESEHKTNNIEKYEFRSKGDIGVTSASDMISRWREIIININELVLKDLDVLFMQIY